ncbi:MAG: HAD family hydrolase [Clostridia bacterium]|nr:HAD family hydrolase [Clostridia bacterium]
MIKAVIFDLDGTLVNSIEDLCNSANFALSKYGFPQHELAKYNYFVGHGMTNLIETVIPKESLNKENFQKVYDTFIEHYSSNYLVNTAAFDGILESLKTLKENGIALAVLSNKKDEFTQRIAKELFGDLFDVVLGKKEGCPLKPDPYSTLMVLNGLGVTAKECAFLGDSGVDMETAVNSGCLPVGVLWGLRTADELKNSGAKHLIHNPTEIAPFILGF